MKEYIDRRELIEILDRHDIEKYNGIVYSIIMQAPAHDVVKVVRCKNCKNHRELNRTFAEERMYVDGCVWCLYHGMGVMGEDFCNYGE